MKELGIIQGKLKAPKNQVNKFGGYRYRSAEDILEAVKSLLQETNCVLTITDDIIEVAGRVYIKATARLINSKGCTIEVSASAREEESKKGMDASQITGAASSYARKYALNGLFCKDDTKDADATNDHGKGEDKPQKTEQMDMSNVVQKVYECDTYAQLKSLWENFSKYDDGSLKKAIAARRKELGV